MKNIITIVLILLLTQDIKSQEQTQTFLSLKNTGVKSFQEKYSEYDGRGTIILILDTGVDMGVEGLTRTSTGETKVIDVQDFTGQGNIPFYEAEIDEIDDKFYFLNEEFNYKVKGANNLSMSAKNDEYFIGLLNESLWINSGSKAGDVNGNGTKNDDFYFVLFKTSLVDDDFWVVYLDTDADGDVSDEKPLRNYKEKYDSFTIPNIDGIPKFTMGLNIYPDINVVSFVFDDGSHGTHCAGIAAGYKIGNAELNGVAPGAKLVGLKLGNNNYSGGATVAESMKNSYLYADKLSREAEEPCIINMSFGIGSEIEGYADIEIFLKELTDKNPYLYIATSNGNEGPGLSTSGMPAASASVFSSGAVLSEEVGNDIYSTVLKKDIILHFSSRGGEVYKPDVVSPGASVSTVPNFCRGDKFWGTSMASPYSAGVMAVLLGAVKHEYPEIKIPSQLLYKVLRESAQPMDGYDIVDQGGGLINIENAFDLLKKYIRNNEIDNFISYTTSSFAPNMPAHPSNSLYIRDGSYLNGTEKFYFRVSANRTDNTQNFYRIFNLESESDWIKLLNKKVHIRNDQCAYVSMMLNDSILNRPGLYNGKISARRSDKSNMHEFDLMSTIVIPHRFCKSSDHSLDFNDVEIDPGMHKRYFLKIPVGASNFNVEFSTEKNNFCDIRYYIHDPDGRERLYGTFNVEKNGLIKTINLSDLTPGVFELVVLGQFTSLKKSLFDLHINLGSISVLGHSIVNGSFKVANYLPKAEKYELKGDLLGYCKTYNLEISGTKQHEIPFELKKGEVQKKFEISLTKEDFNKLTDFAFMIYDSTGKVKSTDGLSYKDGSISLNRNGTNRNEKYIFVLIPGLTHAESSIEVKVNEKTYFENSTNMQVKFNRRKDITMYPDIEYRLDVDYVEPNVNLGPDESLFGKITFISPRNNNMEYSKILSIKNKE